MSNEPDEFEADEDVTDEFETPHRPSGMVVSVRIGPEDSERLIDLAESSGRTVSQVARQAIRSFLSFSGPQRQEVTVSTDPDANLIVRTSDDPVPTEASAARAYVEDPVLA